MWVPIVHLLLGTVMVAGAWFVITRERERLHTLATAKSPGDIAHSTPHLPGILTQVESFKPLRCFILSAGLFILNPIDLSCAIAASLDLRLSSVSGIGQLCLAIAFVCVAAVSVAAPVLYLWLRGDHAAAPLEKLRLWIATHTKLLNATLLLVIAIMQVAKGINGL